MIDFVHGDLFTSDAQALVNTVNTVGVMGKGIALQFKKMFPHNFEVYRLACINHELKIGGLLVVHDYDLVMGEKIIINFPTKQHWRNPSAYSYIESGLIVLHNYLEGSKVDSVAIPPLGCGNGGLDWNIVKPMILQGLEGLEQMITVFEP